MVTLLLLQSLLLLGVIATAVFWKIQVSARLQALQDSAVRSAAAEQKLQAVLMSLQLELNEVRDVMRRPAVEPSPVVADLASDGAADLTMIKRAQALKMLRRGDSSESVSKALGVPRSYIQLLEKVQVLVRSRAASA